MKAKLDLDSIARGLGARRRGTVQAGSGYFGAMQLVADVQARFQTPAGGGRATDPKWTERRLVPLSADTLKRLDALAKEVRDKAGVSIEPMQLAAMLLEASTGRASEEQLSEVVGLKGHRAAR